MSKLKQTRYPPWPSLRVQSLAAECLRRVVSRKFAIEMQAASTLSIINDNDLIDAFNLISERASIRRLPDTFRLTKEEQSQLIILDVVSMSTKDERGRIDIDRAQESSKAAIEEILKRRQEAKAEVSISENLNEMMNDIELTTFKMRKTIRMVLNLYLSSKERIELLRIRDPEKAELALNELDALYMSAIVKIRDLNLTSKAG